jgi:alpha-galactosidase/6-phospho-beta-glucosidase family protein
MLWGSIGEDAGVKVVEALGTVTEQYGEVNGAAQGVIECFGRNTVAEIPSYVH